MDYEFKETLLYVEDISVAYDEHVIIKDVSLIEKDVIRLGHETTAQIIAIVGRSGRGKSTFLKALTGLVKPAKGKVLIKDFKDPAPNTAKLVKEGDIGFVDQKYTLFRHKTVTQSLRFALRKTELTHEQKNEKIDQALVKWGLETCKDKYPNELSGGQRQRTAIIEQLFSSDRFLVLDEPFSGLDVGNIQEVKNSFAILNDESEFNTVIFTSHDIELAIELAQSIYVIGYPTVNGELMPYGSIVAKFDLRERGVAWTPYGDEHYKLYQEIVHQMMIS